MYIITYVDSSNLKIFKEASLITYNRYCKDVEKIFIVTDLEIEFDSDIPIEKFKTINEAVLNVKSNVFILTRGNDFLTSELSTSNVTINEKLKASLEPLSYDNMHIWGYFASILRTQLYSNKLYFGVGPQLIITDLAKVISGNISFDVFIHIYWLLIIANNMDNLYINNNGLFSHDDLNTNGFEKLPEKYAENICKNSLSSKSIFHCIFNDIEGVLDMINSNTVKVEELKSIMDCLQIKSCKYPFVRIGNHGDGGYVCVDLGLKYDVIYGFGVGNNYNFEIEFVSKFGTDNCKCYLYDPTVDLTNVPNNFKFFKLGLDSCKYGEYDTLDNITNETNLTQNQFLKMDIENYEWMSLLKSKTLNKYKQIVLEIHNLHNYRVLPKYKIQCLELLNTYFDLVHVHANNCAKSIILDDYYFHTVLELTFIRKDYNIDSKIIKNPTLPIPEDCPNDNKIKEVFLYNYYPYSTEKNAKNKTFPDYKTVCRFTS